jgi:hypothetical protein
MTRAGLILIAMSAALAACGGAQQRADDLLEAVRSYNESVRWQRYPAAAARVPVKERDAFLEEREDLEKELHISDYDLVKVGTAKKETAAIDVKYTWYKESEGVVHETRAVQTWERHGNAWMIIDERRAKGPEMPGLREPGEVDPVAPALDEPAAPDLAPPTPAPQPESSAANP